MATEEQKKIRQLRLFNDLIFGFAKGLYDLFGESALAMADTIGEDILQEMEHELGLEIQGENPQDILTELERLLVDEYGLVKDIRIEINEETHHIDMVCEGCLLWRATRDLREEDVPPFTCVPMMMATAALRKRLGRRAKFVGITQEPESRVCDIDFVMLE